MTTSVPLLIIIGVYHNYNPNSKWKGLTHKLSVFKTTMISDRVIVAFREVHIETSDWFEKVHYLISLLFLSLMCLGSKIGASYNDNYICVHLDFLISYQSFLLNWGRYVLILTSRVAARRYWNGWPVIEPTPSPSIVYSINAYDARWFSFLKFFL